MPTKSVSTYQSEVPITGATGLLVSTFPVKIFAIEGNVNSTTGTPYYIQIHGTSTPVSGTTVPLYSVNVVPANYATQINPFSFVYTPEGMDTKQLTNPNGATQATATDGGNVLPVYAFISSTDTVFTSVAASTNLRVDFEATDAKFLPGQTQVGDAITGVSSLVVFSDPNLALNLIKIEINNLIASSGYVYIFPNASPVTGDKPWMRFKLDGTMGAKTSLEFGSGVKPLLIDTAGGTPHSGCYLFFSFNATTYTVSANTSFAMKAWYK